MMLVFVKLIASRSCLSMHLCDIGPYARSLHGVTMIWAAFSFSDAFAQRI
jgi:hypothetical protein